jgi:hypothetical protein
LELNVGEYSASHPGHLIPGEKALNTSIHIDPKGYWQCHVTNSITGFALPLLCWSVLLFVKKKVPVGLLTPLLQVKSEIHIVIMQKNEEVLLIILVHSVVIVFQ